MSGWRGGDIADVLVNWCKLRAVGLVSVTGCYMGGHGLDQTGTRVMAGLTTNTFGEHLHTGLCQYGVITTLFARTESVAVITQEDLAALMEEKGRTDLLTHPILVDQVGRKVIASETRNNAEKAIPRTTVKKLPQGTKIRFDWVNGKSQCTPI
ncbi:MAG: hypothetical protein ACREF3_12840 [Acetobacteraceae bacterium]